jgi:hypothetical protein
MLALLFLAAGCSGSVSSATIDAKARLVIFGLTVTGCPLGCEGTLTYVYGRPEESFGGDKQKVVPWFAPRGSKDIKLSVTDESSRAETKVTVLDTACLSHGIERSITYGPSTPRDKGCCTTTCSENRPGILTPPRRSTVKQDGVTRDACYRPTRDAQKLGLCDVSFQRGPCENAQPSSGVLR